LPADRVALAQPEEVDKLEEGEVATRLELAAGESRQARAVQSPQ
jgi:hypothetical protein